MKKTRNFRVLVNSLVLIAGAIFAFPYEPSAAACPAGSIEAFPGSADCVVDPSLITKFTQDLVIPPAMPQHKVNLTTVRSWVKNFNLPVSWWRLNEAKIRQFFANVDYYEIAVRPLEQQILDPNQGFPATPVWSYGAIQAPGTVGAGGTFNYPAFTIEAKVDRPVLVKWINDLKDPVTGQALPHILTDTVDQTVHWANPAGDCAMAGKTKDCTGTSQLPYTGPVPMVTHVHGAHVGPESDGYPEAWWLPDATDVTCKEDVGPSGTHWCYGTLFDQKIRRNREPGTAYFLYPNDQRASTLWYHDHTLGMTRLNVYAGPAGFYLLRGGEDDTVYDIKTRQPAVLPGPAPQVGDAGGPYYEIPIVIQGRSFKPDGSLFYPTDRAFFEGLTPAEFDAAFPFAPGSDILPIWNPEAFFNVMVVNGVSWPKLEVEPRRYRIRWLNGCNSRFLIIKTDNPAVTFWQIGAEGGFLKKPVELTELLIAPAERADVIMDFSKVPMGTNVTIENVGPDEPFGGGEPGVDFPAADEFSTKPVMQFQVVTPLQGQDDTTPPKRLFLPRLADINPIAPVRKVSLNEEESKSVCVLYDESTEELIIPVTQVACNGVAPVGTEIAPFGPTEAVLGTVLPFGSGNPLDWSDAITENPGLNDTETWEIHNFTADAHPIHLHLVTFRVVERIIATADSPHYHPVASPVGTVMPRQPWESGWKDTVIAYPGEITKIQATFDIEGLYVWHCHIVEHEDNEMMRPYYVGNPANSPVPVVAQQ